MSGFGRTGKWFAVDHWGVAPDIMTMAKGLTSSYAPLAAVVVSEPIASFFEDRFLAGGLTYGSHPLGCAAGVATLQVYQEEGLIDNSACLGLYLGERLQELKARHRSVGDVRCIGLFAAIELVKDRATKEPLPSAPLNKFLRERGLFSFLPLNLVFITPPLCINQAQLDDGLALIDRALEIADQSTTGR